MTIDSTKIATDAAKAIIARLDGKPRAWSPNFKGRAFQHAYFAYGGTHEHVGRATREYEISVALPDMALLHARDHVAEAARVLHARLEYSTVMREWPAPEYKEWCTLVTAWVPETGDRIYPACAALEMLSIDPSRQYRHEFERIVSAYSRALHGIDQRTAHLTGKAKWSERWTEYKAALIEWYYEDWLPFIDHMRKITGEV
ncbi:hypothetical protein [Rhodoferax sp.]|uniref:hypothetical protein n=1 Tax=Rhodoferax sp. TaxID=50421 RepID=UPI0028411BB8|nr:hypothetical protein [Rhodoferax sp.]MDR3371203.1 hypothetical protein [Rhodoferax sp.]